MQLLSAPANKCVSYIFQNVCIYNSQMHVRHIFNQISYICFSDDSVQFLANWPKTIIRSGQSLCLL